MLLFDYYLLSELSQAFIQVHVRAQVTYNQGIQSSVNITEHTEHISVTMMCIIRAIYHKDAQ